ncbi:Protein RIK [Camellia lanceoleosa]|uniref:Protein RIK n=1 Tax=Camellia lanceoleosa TaxID=1840588 RepID=A0ACC0IUA7_9ERIC|nr:Protein RIK [Camellia lanceoleosa]
MTEDNCSRVSSAESMAAAESSTTKQRRKRKWDQPAESLITAGVAVPGILPLSNIGSLAAINLPGASSASGALLANPLTTSPATILQVFQAPLIQPHATVVVQKINQQKIQDELIAREIVINDADSAVRYKLTKRQTQEEIQKCTGAVVITRGKYRPPNAAPDGEKPLYLHISAGAHLETTVERIKSVDLAAAMVEEMLKQGSVNNVGTVTNHLSTCVYLGFEADPSLNIAARIRGPNDQYVNHIMNETGATVLLRGRGSGNSESAFGEEGQQPLHLYLSSNNPKSIESAKLLAENLLDTISIECCASRVSSSKVYGAVPPPHQLLNGVQSSGNEVEANNSSAASLTSVPVNSVAIPPISSATHPGITTTLLQGTLSQSIGLSCGHSQPNIVCHPQPSLTGGTSYSGYGGIYPQATPLQQVALALRRSPSLVNSTVAPATTAASTAANSSETLSYEEKRRLQKRKFQELPVASKGHANPHQGSKFQKAGEPTPDLGVRNISTMQAPKKLVRQSVNGMVLPLPRSMPPPPPPPKFNSPVLPSKVHEKSVLNKSKPESVPDTLIKLMEYGEEDDEPDEITEEPYKRNSNGSAAPKPFWAV